jgi:hypothetical protein
MVQTLFSHYVTLQGADDGSTLTWTGTSAGGGNFVEDSNADGNLDTGQGTDPADYLIVPSQLFTGFYYLAPNGQSYAIYASGSSLGDYFIPYNGADYDLLANMPNSGDTTLQAENFSPTGNPVCFISGSKIATPEGESCIEDLEIGDRVLVAFGSIQSVKWVGRQTVSTRFGPAERLMPVRFAAGSLGEGVPHTDLTVTADHGMFVDGVICHAGALVNGVTITRVPLSELGESFTVYHVETETHEIILANGAPAETFIDNVSRRVFDNFAEFEALYGDVPEMEELPYPRAMSARQVPQRIKARLAGKAAA